MDKKYAFVNERTFSASQIMRTVACPFFGANEECDTSTLSMELLKK